MSPEPPHVDPGSTLTDESAGSASPVPHAGDRLPRVLAEVGLLFLVTCVLIRLFLMVRDATNLNDNWQIVVPFLFIFAPVLAARITRRPIHPDITLPEPLGREMARASWTTLKVVAVIYPGFVIGNHVYQVWGLPWFSEAIGMDPSWPPHEPRHGLPDDLAQIILWQLIAVGYAEEYFYRGYMQTRLRQAFGPSRLRFLGAQIGAPFWITALLFTAGHSLVQFQWWQPAIFFPSLVFGWLRERTGNVLAPALFHAFSNVAMITLDSIYGISAG